MTGNAEIERWLREAKQKGIFDSIEKVDEISNILGIERFLYPASVQRTNKETYALIKVNGDDMLGVFCRGMKPAGFHGHEKSFNGLKILICPLVHENAVILRSVLPFTAPCTLSKRDTTFGVGDRLGIATPGHIQIFKRYKASPVFAQQSVREITLTQRSFEDVLDSATWACFREGFNKPWGADGDHLKTEDQVKKVLSIGYTMVTADVSDYIRGEYTSKDNSDVIASYKNLSSGYRKVIEKRYLSSQVNLDSGQTITFSEEELGRAALIYGEALEHARRLYEAGNEVRGERDFDFELSIDETSTPTTPLAHVFIAKELERIGIKVISIAPRFVGEFQKGIDYIGDLKEFEESFRVHAAIAGKFGYKISIHSGSDKFLVFPVIGRITGGRFHIKTAGTNWLEALKIISRKDPSLFKFLYKYAQQKFGDAQKYYHITPDQSALPSVSAVDDSKLPDLFSNSDVRQVLHVTYGEMLKDTGIKKKIFMVLGKYKEDYWQALGEHIGKHLDLLNVPLAAS